MHYATAKGVGPKLRFFSHTSKHTDIVKEIRKRPKGRHPGIDECAELRCRGEKEGPCLEQVKAVSGAQGHPFSAVFLPSGLRYSFLGAALSEI